MTRYLAALSAARSLTQEDIERLSDIAQASKLVIHHASPRWFLASCAHLPMHRDPGHAAFLLGEAFARDATDNASMQVQAGLTERDSDPSAILRQLWGSFVVFLPDRNGPAMRVTRSPFGRLGCLYAQQDGLVLLGSDMPALRLAGLKRPAIDVAALSRWIGCGSAWKKDPVSGVIGAQKGPLISVV